MEDLSIYCEDYSDWRIFKMYIEAVNEYNLKVYELQKLVHDIQTRIKNNIEVDNLGGHVKIAEGYIELSRCSVNKYKNMIINKEHKKPMTKEDADNMDRFVSSLASRSK